MKRTNTYFDLIWMNASKQVARIKAGAVALWLNKRLRLAILLLVVVGPAINYSYLILPVDGFGDYLLHIGSFKIVNTIEGPSWFWYSIWDYVWIMGSILAIVVYCVGAFFLFPRKYIPSYLLALPIGYYISTLIYTMFYVESMADRYYGNLEALPIVLIIIASFIGLMLADHYMFKSEIALEARQSKIVELLNTPKSERKSRHDVITEMASELKNRKNELFIRKSA